MDYVGDMTRIEHGSLLGSGRRSANIDTPHGALRTENRGTSGDRLKIGNVAHANPGNIGEALHGGISS